MSFTERIRINGVPITEARVVDIAERVRLRSHDLVAPDGTGPLTPTFFEVTTAMAFTCFAEEAVDIAVVEVGMGGRLDSTNVISPIVSVITNIDLEHTEYLGPTIAQIAEEKAGIIKAGVPVVTGATQPEAISVIEREAERVGTRVFRMLKDFSPLKASFLRSWHFDYRGIGADYRDLPVALRGGHQVGNACLAVATIECAVRAGELSVAESAIRAGLETTVWEGRLERVAARPDIYLDGAHNPASAVVLAEALRELRTGYRSLILVLGILQDKDHEGIITCLAPLADRIIVTQPRYARALDAATLATSAQRVHRAVARADTISDALASARAGSSPDDLIVVTGSLYTVGEARSVLAGTAAGPFAELQG